MPKVTAKEITRAEVSYMHNAPNGIEYHTQNFWDFLGNPKDETPLDSNYTFNEEACRKIEMLNSPHVRSMLRAYEVVKGVK